MDTTALPGRHGLSNATKQRLFAEARVEDIAEARGTGFDVKAMKALIRMRRKDQAQRQEEEAILDLYKAALGMD